MIGWLRQQPLPEAPPETVTIAGKNILLSIRRLPNAKWMTLRLAPDGSEVRITLPRWGRTMDALSFVESRQDWLASQLAAVPKVQPVQSGGAITYRGNPLKIEWDARHPRVPHPEGDAILLGGAEDAVSSRIRRWLEQEALRLCAIDLADYCSRAGVAVPALQLSRAQRRWGSCSRRQGQIGAIRINWRLIQAPDAVRRSVVAHEVAHLVHFDHSPAFYALLAQLYEGDLSAADLWLKRQGRSLYAAFG